MEQPVFHVVLDGRTVGPYDRRTIVGMRIKQTLTSDHVLIASAGGRLTVADLIGQQSPGNNFSPNRTGGFSLVQATYPASLLKVEGGGIKIFSFKGEVEARVQSDALRIAGRFRRGLGWAEGRVKLPLDCIVHTRGNGSQVELWLRRPGGAPMQRLVLELFTQDAAQELIRGLPGATPWPQTSKVRPRTDAGPQAANTGQVLWVSVLSMVAVVGVALAVLLYRRLY